MPDVRLPPALLDGPRRVIISGPMKAATTYVAAMVARYLGTETPHVEYDWLAQQNVTWELREQLRGRPFALSLHMWPHTSNLAACVAEDMHVALLWRNLGDVIVSYDDHVPRYGAHNPMFFVEGERYVRMSAQERYRHVASGLIPWNLGFYLSWFRLPGLLLHPYEQLIRDRQTFFRDLLLPLGIPIDEAWLEATLCVMPERSRFNKGTVGRSAELFDVETKRRVERYVIEHPSFDELEVLLWELPWQPLELRRASQYDGTVVRTDDDEQAWFVSRGARRAVSRRWMLSRALPALRSAAVVSADDLRRLRLEAPLGPN